MANEKKIIFFLSLIKAFEKTLSSTSRIDHSFSKWLFFHEWKRMNFCGHFMKKCRGLLPSTSKASICLSHFYHPFTKVKVKLITLMKYIILCFSYFLLSVSWDLRAEEEVVLEEESMIDLTHKRLSNSLFYLSNRIDSFFGGERADDLPNGSRLRLFWNFNKEEGVAYKGQGAIRFNIALVETQKKLKVSFKNKYEKESEKNETEVTGEIQKSPSQAGESSFYDLADLLKWRVKIDSGIRIDIPPDPFVRMSLLKSWHFGLYELRPSQQVFWYLKNGLGETTKLDLDRPISGEVLARYENDATWTDELDKFTFFSGPTLYQKLSDKRGLSYGAKVLGESKPTWYVNDYRLEVIYRQLLYRQWFFVEFNPYIHFPKWKDWDRTLGFNLRFELVIGSY